MKIIYTILIQAILLANIYGQNVITEYKDYGSVKHKSTFVYNEQNKPVEKINSTYYKAEKVDVLKSKTEWVYENDNVVIRKEYSFDESDWRIVNEFEIFYDENGCIVSQKKKFYIPPNKIEEKTITMVNEYDCSNPWRNDQDNSFLPDSPSETILTRTRTGDSEIENYEVYDELTGDWTHKGMVERKYNQKNKLVEHFTSLLFYGYALKSIFTYDETGENLIRYQRYIKHQIDSGWILEETREYFYEGSLVRQIIQSNPNGTEFDFFLEYYCDGLLKKNTGIKVNENEVFQVLTYEYDQKIDCPEECEQLENQNLTIYPNPVKDIFYIESDLFQKKSSEVFIYNTLGQLVHRQEVKERVPGIQVQLNPDIIEQNQMLIVHLTSEGGHNISRKILLRK